MKFVFGARQAECQNPGQALWKSRSNSSSGEVLPTPCQGGNAGVPPVDQSRGARGGGRDGILERSPVTCACREKWCHMTQEERNDSLRFNENITFGQLG